eukprot:Opistho-2@37202
MLPRHVPTRQSKVAESRSQKCAIRDEYVNSSQSEVLNSSRLGEESEPQRTTDSNSATHKATSGVLDNGRLAIAPRNEAAAATDAPRQGPPKGVAHVTSNDNRTHTSTTSA